MGGDDDGVQHGQLGHFGLPAAQMGGTLSQRGGWSSQASLFSLSHLIIADMPLKSWKSCLVCFFTIYSVPSSNHGILSHAQLAPFVQCAALQPFRSSPQGFSSRCLVPHHHTYHFTTKPSLPVRLSREFPWFVIPSLIYFKMQKKLKWHACSSHDARYSFWTVRTHAPLTPREFLRTFLVFVIDLISLPQAHPVI